MKINEVFDGRSALQHFWVVYDPKSPDSELGDYFFKASPVELVYWSRGLQERPEDINLRVYGPSQEQEARADAEERFARLYGPFD